MTNQQKFDRLRKLLDEASVYARAVGKLDFDMQCCAPKDGMEQAGAAARSWNCASGLKVRPDR